MSDERFLKEITGGNTYNPPPLTTDCDISVVMGSDLSSTRGLFASINSIISNYDNNEESLCFFVFSNEQDFEIREGSLRCAFNNLPNNVRIFNRKIHRDRWEEHIIYSPEESVQVDGGSTNMEYTFARYYLKPEDVDGVQKVIWIDSDTIFRGSVEEIYNWDLKGKIVAGVHYWQPLRDFLCPNPRLRSIKMKTLEGTKNPFEVNRHLNTGLLVIDLVQMQRQRIIEKWSDLLKLHVIDCLWTQPDKAFNLVLKGDYELLPKEWNVGYLGLQEFQRYINACNDAKMLHWNGIGKPYSNEGRGKSLCVDQFDLYDVVSLFDKGQCLEGATGKIKRIN